MEDLVNFEISKKLKEKGFKNNCIGYYDYAGKFHYNYESAISNKEIYFCHNRYDNIWHRDLIDAPTISQVLKWLRKEEGIHVCIALGEFSDWMYDVSRIDGNMFCKAEDGFQSYEQATLAGIEYCLDNLI